MPASSQKHLAQLILALLGLAALVQGTWSVWREPWFGAFSDSVAYLALADFYRESYTGTVSTVSAAYFGNSRFPPLFPLLLAAAGGGAKSMWPAAIAAQLLSLCALVAIAFYLRSATGTLLRAALLLIPIVLSPARFQLHLNPVSEPLLELLLYTALALSFAQRHRLATLLLLGIAPLARMIALCVVPAVVVWRWAGSKAPASRRLLDGAAVGVLVALPAMAWMAYRSLAVREVSYLDEFERSEVAGLGASPLRWLAAQPLRLIEGFAAQFDTAPGFELKGWCALLLIGALADFVRRWREARLDRLIALVYVAIVVLWPYPDEIPRFLGVITPILLACSLGALDALKEQLRRTGPGVGVPAVAAAVIAVLPLCWACIQVGHDWTQRALMAVEPALERYKRASVYFDAGPLDDALPILQRTARFEAMTTAMRSTMAPGSCVYAVAPELVWLHAQVLAVQVPADLKSAQDARARLVQCRYLFVDRMTVMRSGSTSLPPLFPLALVKGYARPLLLTQEGSGPEAPLAVALFDLRALPR